MPKMPTSVLLVVLAATPVAAQAPNLPPAVDVTGADVRTFIKQLPADAISDRPIRVADVGGYRVGIWGVFRPQSSVQDAVLHEVKTTEVYQMLEGAGTLVTGGTLIDQRRTPGNSTVRGSRIEGGLSRRVVPGDWIIIPGGVPHWWSHLDSDIKYAIVRADPEGKTPLK